MVRMVGFRAQLIANHCKFPHGHEGQHISNHSIFMCVPKSPKLCSLPKHTGNTLPPEAMGRRARPAPRLGEQRTYAAAAHAPQDMKAVMSAIAHFKPPPALASAGPAHPTTSCSAATRQPDVARKNAAAEAGENKCGSAAHRGSAARAPIDTPSCRGTRCASRRVPNADVGWLELPAADGDE
jgi:hypothetical protein